MDSVRVVRLAAFLYLSLSENGLTEYYISTGGEAQGRQPTATHKSDISSFSLSLSFSAFSAFFRSPGCAHGWREVGPSSLCPGGGGPYSIPFELGGLCAAAAAAISLWLFLLRGDVHMTSALRGGGGVSPKADAVREVA